MSASISFPAFVRQQREAAGLRGYQLAARAGCPPSLISAYESGKSLPSLRSLPRLAGALGVSPHTLVDLAIAGQQ